jgi:hypothetical protein
VLALLGFLTVAVLFVLIVSRRASPLVALIAVPVATALAAGCGLATAKFIVTGVQQIAPVAAMFVFAILYFGIITDAGTLEPVINAILGVRARRRRHGRNRKPMPGGWRVRSKHYSPTARRAAAAPSPPSGRSSPSGLRSWRGIAYRIAWIT